jgi:hypothetical protein
MRDESVVHRHDLLEEAAQRLVGLPRQQARDDAAEAVAIGPEGDQAEPAPDVQPLPEGVAVLFADGVPPLQLAEGHGTRGQVAK